MLIPVPYGSIGCTHRQPKYSSPNRSNKQKDKSCTKEPTFLENGGYGKKMSGEWAKS